MLTGPYLPRLFLVELELWDKVKQVDVFLIELLDLRLLDLVRDGIEFGLGSSVSPHQMG